MKKILSLLLVVISFMVMFSMPSTARAEGAITNDEQRILDSLDKGVTVNGKTFHILDSDRNQAVNYLKQHDLTNEQVNSVVADIEASRQLVEAQNVDVTNINTLEELVRALPTDVKNQLRANISSVGNVLGLVITFTRDGVIIVDPNENSQVGSGGQLVYNSGNPIKQTGANYTSSLIVFVSLLIITVGAFLIGKTKYVQGA